MSLVVAGPSARAAGEVSGNATGRVIAIAPISGGLSLEVGLGSAIADLKGTTPRAESATLKPGIVGLLAGSTVPLPKPSKADLRSEKQVDRTAVVPEIGVGGVALKATRERASVSSAEDDGGLAARARTDLTDIEVAGLVEISGGTAEAEANGKVATGSASVGRITVKLSGVTLVDLHDLEWRTVSVLGEKPAATFSVGSATIQGDRQSIDSPEELASALEPLAPLLAPAGLAIRVPQAKELNGGISLSPLVIESVNATALRSSVGALYPEIAPAYNELATQIQGQAAEAGLALLAANVGLSIAAGNGGARVSLGGASSSIATKAASSMSLDDGSTRTPTDASTAVGSGSDLPSSGGFFTDEPPAREVQPFELSAPAVIQGGAGAGAPAGRGVSSPTAPGAVVSSGGPRAPVQLQATPISDGGGAPLPAPLVLALVLAAVTSLALRDQMSTGRRAALRLARGRTAGA